MELQAHTVHIYTRARTCTYTARYTQRRIRFAYMCTGTLHASLHVLRDYASFHYADRSLESKVRTVSVARTCLCVRVRILVFRVSLACIIPYGISDTNV